VNLDIAKIIIEKVDEAVEDNEVIMFHELKAVQ
jgi:hypothetical protein